MASRKVKLRIDTELQKKALDDAVKGIRKVDQAMEESGKTSTKMGDAGVKANKRNAHAAGQAAMQLQDVAVQAQMGTDSMRILGQQGPQLLSAFGPKGMLAGLAVAVGAGLVSAFKKPKEEVGELIEEIERLEGIGVSIADLNVDRLESSIEAATKRAEAARESFQRMMDTRAKSEQNALAATDALIEAEMLLIELKGGSTDQMKADLALSQALRANEEESNKARNERVKALQDEKDRLKELQNQMAVSLEETRKQTFELEKQEAIQKELFAEQSRTQEKVETGFRAGTGMAPSDSAEKAAQEAFVAAQQGTVTLQGIKEEINRLQIQQDDLRMTIRRAADAVEESEATLAQDLEQLKLAKRSKDVLAAGQNLGSNLDDLAQSINEAAEQFGGKAAQGIVPRIKDLLSDGIQTNELAELLQLTQQLTNLVNQQFGTQNKTMADVIGQLRIQEARSRQLQIEVNNIGAKVQTPGRR